MADSAALLVDEILPHEPMRQWVLSVPFPLRFLFASNPKVMSRVLGIVYCAVATDWVYAWSRMVSFVQENLGLLPVIKSFSREQLETQRFETHNSELLTFSKRQILLQSILAPAVSFLASAGLLLLL